MNSKLLSIIDHYGLFEQLKHFHSEVYELIEAIIQRQETLYYSRSKFDYSVIKKNNRHVAEEIADCYVMLEQFRNYFGISNSELKEIIEYKIERQLRRIENEKFKKQK